MQSSEKKCGSWGPFLDGDPVMYREIRWRVIAANRKDVPLGTAPITPEDEEYACMVGIKKVPIDDLSRV